MRSIVNTLAQRRTGIAGMALVIVASSVSTLASFVDGIVAGAANVEAMISTCSSSELATVWVNQTGAAGSRASEYGFKNVSGHRCELEGYPTVQMLTKSGGKLSTKDQHAALGAFQIMLKPVIIAHDETAYFGIEYESSTGYMNAYCPTSAALELTAPGTTRGVLLSGVGGRIQPYGGSIQHLHCGILSMTPVSATRFQ